MPQPAATSCLVMAALLAASAAAAATIAPAPKADVQGVTDTIQGTTIADPYRWLENGADPKVKAWSAAENSRTRAYLDGLKQRPAVRAELKRIISGSSVSYYSLSAQGGHVFSLFFDPAKQQAMLVELDASGPTRNPAESCSTRTPWMRPATSRSTGSSPRPMGGTSPCHCPKMAARMATCMCST